MEDCINKQGLCRGTGNGWLNRFVALLAAVALAAASGVPGFAAFLDPMWSARAAALGGAFGAMGDDATCVFYNPAAAARQDRAMINFSYARLFTGMQQVDFSLNEFAYLQPVSKLSSVGVGYGRFNAAGLHSEDTAMVSYAQRFDDQSGSLISDASLGVSARYLTQRYVLDQRSAQDPVFRNGRHKSGMALDIHLHSISPGRLLPGLSAGVSLKAVNRPDIGFLEKDRLPRELTAGVVYQRPGLNIPLDVVKRDDTSTTPRVGLEYLTAKDRLALRFGTDTLQVASGFGYRHRMSDQSALIFDYAFMWPLKMKGSSGSHRVTLGMKF